jgi:hypothetical protein
VDTNSLEITTNWLECLDIELSIGVNTITLYAMDRAGNVSTNVFNYTFVLPTNPPVLKVWWPQEGAQVCGTNFTVRGWVSDATAMVTAEIIGGGTTTTADALVERDGRFWVKDLPLAGGTNSFELTASDVAANVAVTNITIVKSTVELTIDPPDGSVLNQPYVTVTGTINVSDYKVWVNGVEATLNGDGTWAAQDVPTTGGGTAVIQARAIPYSDNGGNGNGGSGGQSATAENRAIPIRRRPKPGKPTRRKTRRWC